MWIRKWEWNLAAHQDPVLNVTYLIKTRSIFSRIISLNCKKVSIAYSYPLYSEKEMSTYILRKNEKPTIWPGEKNPYKCFELLQLELCYVPKMAAFCT